jgi:hypothetical protein
MRVYHHHRTSFGDLVRQQKEMAALTLTMRQLKILPSYLVHKHGIDAEFYREWVTGNPGDLAELIVCYHPHLKERILEDLDELLKVAQIQASSRLAACTSTV